MAPRDPWPHETPPGFWLRRTSRTRGISFDLTAEVQQLWCALAIHHKMPLNGLAGWAICELSKHGKKVERRPPDLGAGLKKPKKKFQSGNKYSENEWKVWNKLKATYPGGWAGVLTVALFALYWLEPVDVRIANLANAKAHHQPEIEEDEELAA